MKKIALLILFLSLLCVPANLLAQTEPEDIALNNDAFQDSFYESLKQKGIENYDKAITALEKCLKLEPNNATVLFELGKNYLAQKDYKRAYDSFEKATKIDAKNKWFWVGMYDVCYETRDWDQAIVIVNKLTEFKGTYNYKEDLVSLFMNTQQFDKALTLINELNETVGKSELRENYKNQILKDNKYQGTEVENLISQLKKNPKDEASYMTLIALYSEGGQEDKALEVARQMEKEVPNSDWAQVSLFKNYINSNDGAKAVQSMNIVLKSKNMDSKIKQRMLNEFLIFVKDKPEFDSDLENAVNLLKEDSSVKTALEIGKFYHMRRNTKTAIKYYQLYLQDHPNDFETILLIFRAQSEKLEYADMAVKAETMIELYPLQPEFYYYAGLAYNESSNFKKAKELLEMGIDYVVNDFELEVKLNYALARSYEGLGDPAKRDLYRAKADKLQKEKKK